MTNLSLGIPQTGSPDSTEEPKIASDLTSIQSWANGNIDTDNLTAATSLAAGINTAGTKVKGAVFNAGPGTRTNTAYGALGDAADQVTGITLATNGLLAVWYQGTWQAQSPGTGKAAIFIGANQLKLAAADNAAAVTSAALTPSQANHNAALSTCALGLFSPNSVTGYAGGDATTGQAVASLESAFGGTSPLIEINGANVALETASTNVGWLGGPCYVFAAAGTYTISVQYKASSGTVTASGRHLWVQAISFG